jgi:hypothetical protein
MYHPSISGNENNDAQPGKTHWRPEAVLDLYNCVLASFLFVSPWLFGYASIDARIDVWASGALIVLVSFASFVAFSDWQEWFNLLLGIWLVASPWVLGFAHTRAMHFSIGIGSAVAFLAALELFLIFDNSSRSPSPTRGDDRSSAG